MDINKAFSGDWIKATDFGQGETRTLTIKHVSMEKVGEDEKPVVAFLEMTQGLVLNKSNATSIANLYGPDTTAWAGKQITLFQTWVDFAGKQVQAIRVRAPQAGAAPPAAAAAPKPPPRPNAPQKPDVPWAADKKYWVLPDGDGDPVLTDGLDLQTHIAASGLKPAQVMICPDGGSEYRPAAELGFRDTVPW